MTTISKPIAGSRGSAATAATGSKNRKIVTCENAGQLDWVATNKLALRAASELKIGKSGDSATGALFEVESEGRPLYLFISTDKPLCATSPLDLSNAKLLLRDLQPGKECIRVSLSRGRVRRMWNTPPRVEHSGNTVVELSDEAARDCRSRGAHFLKIVEPRPGEEVIVWWWWPLAAGTVLFSFKPRALIESISEKELHVLLDDIPIQEKKEWGDRGSLLLRQLYGGASVILINRSGEAVAMDTIQSVNKSTDIDIKFARSCRIDTNLHTYPFKSKILLLTQLLVGRNCEHSRPPANTCPKPPKELQGITEEDLQCIICQEPAENAVNCDKCQNILCKTHLSQLSKCPMCKSTPFKTQPNGFVRRLISKLEVPCPDCGAPIARGDLSNHKNKFCLKREGEQSSGAKDEQKVTASASTVSKSMTIGEHQADNAIGVTRDITSLLQFEMTSKAKTYVWKSQSGKLRDFIEKLKCAQLTKIDFIHEIFIYIDDCLPLESRELNSRVTPVEIFEFVSVSINTLRNVLAQLRASSDSDSVNQEQSVPSPEATAFDLSVVDTLKAQYLRAEEMLSSLQFLLNRLLTTDKEVSVDNGSNAAVSLEVVQMTRTLFKELADLFNGGKVEHNSGMVISEMTDRLYKFLQHFTPVVLPQTSEFKSVLATMESKLNSSSTSTVVAIVAPINELIRQELEWLSDVQRALTNLEILLTHSSSNDCSPLTISLNFPTGFELTTGIHEECQRAIINITVLIFQLNSTVCQKLHQLRSGLGDINTEDLEHCVLQMVGELRNKLCEIARNEGKNCTNGLFLKEMAKAILDCYNSIPDKVFKYVNSVMVERENQNYDLNSRFEAVLRLLLDFQQQRTFQDNLVHEQDTEIGELKQQLPIVKNQLLNAQQQRSGLENLVHQRDIKIAEIQQQLDTHSNEVLNQRLNIRAQRTLTENLVNEGPLRYAKELPIVEKQLYCTLLYLNLLLEFMTSPRNRHKLEMI